MKQKLSDGHYKTAAEYVDDFLLIRDNAITFNGEYSWAICFALNCKNWMNEQFKNKAVSREDEWHRWLADIMDQLQEDVRNAPSSTGPARVHQIEGIHLD
jgi:hypothetical protein